MSVTNNSREDCGFGCMLSRYKLPLMIGGGIVATALTAGLAAPLLAPAIGSIGLSEGIAAGGIAAVEAISGQSAGMIGVETVLLGI